MVLLRHLWMPKLPLTFQSKGQKKTRAFWTIWKDFCVFLIFRANNHLGSVRFSYIRFAASASNPVNLKALCPSLWATTAIGDQRRTHVPAKLELELLSEWLWTSTITKSKERFLNVRHYQKQDRNWELYFANRWYSGRERFIQQQLLIWMIYSNNP